MNTIEPKKIEAGILCEVLAPERIQYKRYKALVGHVVETVCILDRDELPPNLQYIITTIIWEQHRPWWEVYNTDCAACPPKMILPEKLLRPLLPPQQLELVIKEAALRGEA